MAKFEVEENFQFGGGLRIAGTILEISDTQALTEKGKGKVGDYLGRSSFTFINASTPFT